MNKILCLVVLLMVSAVAAELQIPQTAFRKAPMEQLRNYAEAGRADAQLELALRYYAGYQVEQDASKALQWMKLSADQKLPEALYLLSRMYAEGIGTEVNAEKEKQWFAKALAANPEDERLLSLYKQYLEDSDDPQTFLKICADAGYLAADMELQLPEALKLYREGKYEKARPLLIQLANQGSAECAYAVGRMYADGVGNLEADPIDAFVWFSQAAEGGFALAQYELAVRYQAGIGVESDQEQARSWMRKAAASGSAEARFQLAEIEFDRAVAADAVVQSGADAGLKLDEYKKALRNAVKLYKAAAEQNHAEALYVMGRLTASGEGVLKNPQVAVRYYERALSAGYAKAGFYLGMMAHAGLGIPEDLSRAVQYYQAAADQGVPGALYYLANCYRFGEGVPKQPAKGEGLYYGKILKDFAADEQRFASTEGWEQAAAREYGIIRWNRADSIDRLVEAAHWLGMAAQGGDANARQIYQSMQKQIRKMKDGAEFARTTFKETPVNPRADAALNRRHQFIFPYIEREAEQVPPGARIMFVRKGLGNQQAVNGSGRDGLQIKYIRPAKSRALGYSGIVLVGMEFVDRKTGDHYWSFAEHVDKEPLIEDRSAYDLVVSVDTSFASREKLTAWAVVYGHLNPEQKTISVFSARVSKTESLAALFKQNWYSKMIANKIDGGMDLIRVIEGQEQNDPGDHSD